VVIPSFTDGETELEGVVDLELFSVAEVDGVTDAVEDDDGVELGYSPTGSSLIAYWSPGTYTVKTSKNRAKSPTAPGGVVI